jgi:VanZ family protein
MTNRLRFFHTWRALGYGLILLVIYLSLTPAPPNIPIENGDKLGHVGAYTALMAWFAWLYPSHSVRWICAVGFATLGVGLEFAQALTDYRTFELTDMVADTTGVVLGWLAALPPLPNLLLCLERDLFKVDLS